MTPALELLGVGKRFGQQMILNNLNLTVQDGEIVALLGASGSGKTTLLRLIAGLFAPDAGELRIAGRRANTLPPEARGLGYVFQDYALMPHLTALENLTLVMSWMPRHADRRQRALELLRTVGLQGLELSRPEKLSGGQRQRVAIARALAVEPALILLDEPYSALDPVLREGLRSDVAGLIRQAGRSALHVTHDPDEAFAVADRLIVLGAGRVLEDAAPQVAYSQPSSLESARALGRLNELEVLVRGGQALIAGVAVSVAATDGSHTLAWRWEQARVSSAGLPAILEQRTPMRGSSFGVWRVGERRVIAPCDGIDIGAEHMLELLQPLVF